MLMSQSLLSPGHLTLPQSSAVPGSSSLPYRSIMVFPGLKTTAMLGFTSFSEHWTTTLPLTLILLHPCLSYQNTRSGAWPSVKLQSQEPTPNSSSGSHEASPPLKSGAASQGVQNLGMCWDFLDFRQGVWTEAAQGYQGRSALVTCQVIHSASDRGSAVLRQLFRYPACWECQALRTNRTPDIKTNLFSLSD